MPRTLQYLTREDYDRIAQENAGAHWRIAERRWAYHKAAIDIIRTIAPASPDRVIEIGTMGASLVPGSHTLDFPERWTYKNFNANYVHDARVIPWPVPSIHYQVFVALRVFQHLVPRQREAFLEARRISQHLLILVPEVYVDDTCTWPRPRGISLSQFIEWNGGIPPTSCATLGDQWAGTLYYWAG